MNCKDFVLIHKFTAYSFFLNFSNECSVCLMCQLSTNISGTKK